MREQIGAQLTNFPLTRLVARQPQLGKKTVPEALELRSSQNSSAIACVAAIHLEVAVAPISVVSGNLGINKH